MENSRSITINKIPEDVLKQLRTLAALQSISPRDMVITLIRERSEALNLDELIKKLEIKNASTSPVVEVVKAVS